MRSLDSQPAGSREQRMWWAWVRNVWGAAGVGRGCLGPTKLQHEINTESVSAASWGKPPQAHASPHALRSW